MNSQINVLNATSTFENSVIVYTLPTSNTSLIDGSIGFSLDLISDDMPNKVNQLYNNYELLKYKNPVVLEIGYDILKALRQQSKEDYVVSRTGENEILIYRIVNGGYRNIIIDEDGDIEYLDIPLDRRKTYNEHYPFIMGINADLLAAKL